MLKKSETKHFRFCLLFILTGLIGLSLVFGVIPSYAQAPKTLIDLNSATAKELESIKGVGSATAKKIIEGRPYKSVKDLKKAGISEKTIEAMKPYVKVEAASAPAKPAKEAKPAEKAKSSEKAAAKKAERLAPGQKIDLNAATKEEIEALPGIGPAKAKKIIDGRPYKSVEDLKKAGISERDIEKIKPNVMVGAGPAPAKPAAETKPAAKAEKAKTTEKAATKAPAKLAPGQKVNINTATKEQLEALPEIGPVKAQAIIDGRPYKNIEDIMKVKGVKEGTFNKVKDYITVQ